ncbi:hypothetical protein OC842_000864 [Tilletia horrida]|uniref:Ima1 N-terminal domain-containing protein n=1 Tax=Tilletia horrida TaxID=155126 RepID=A0AAN6GG14_9BASI|nr:hypothetical protein OC842_000864 [Tilletia horrida]
MSLLRRWSQRDAESDAASSSRKMAPRRGRGAGPYPAATCHFCRAESFIVPPAAPHLLQQQQQRQRQPDASIYNGRISHGNLDAWLCSACHCYNRTDARERGGMSSWEPAMSDPKMNEASFARRGTPPASTLLVQDRAEPHPFCHTCLTNQSLLMNMLANYLPDESDPTYPEALAQLPTYRASLLSRYPPVCADCTPAVHEHLGRANGLAKQEAMRHFLARGRGAGNGGVLTGKGKEKATTMAQIALEHDAISPAIEVVWRIRGAAWAVTNIGFLVGPLVMGASDEFLTPEAMASPWLLSLSVISILWTAWNPRWRRVIELRRRGSDVRIVGQQKWAVLMHIIAARALQVRHGQRIDWRSASSPSSNGGLSLSNLGSHAEEAFSTALNIRGARPVPTAPTGPILSPPSSSRPMLQIGGLDHLFQRNPLPDADADDEDEDGDSSLTQGRRGGGGGGGPDAMDWTPTGVPEESGKGGTRNRVASAGFAPWASPGHGISASASTPLSGASAANAYNTLGPQRFFAPQQPTGLEDLLLDALRMGEDGEGRADRRDGDAAMRDGARRSGWARWWS